MICKGIWRTEGGYFVQILKQTSRKGWEGNFIDINGQISSHGFWVSNGDYYLGEMPQYKLIERKRGEEKGWPNVSIR